MDTPSLSISSNNDHKNTNSRNNNNSKNSITNHTSANKNSTTNHPTTTHPTTNNSTVRQRKRVNSSPRSRSVGGDGYDDDKSIAQSELTLEGDNEGLYEGHGRGLDMEDEDFGEPTPYSLSLIKQSARKVLANDRSKHSHDNDNDSIDTDGSDDDEALDNLSVGKIHLLSLPPPPLLSPSHSLSPRFRSLLFPPSLSLPRSPLFLSFLFTLWTTSVPSPSVDYDIDVDIDDDGDVDDLYVSRDEDDEEKGGTTMHPEVRHHHYHY